MSLYLRSSTYLGFATKRTGAITLYLALAILSGFGLLGKLYLVQQIVPLPRLMLLLACIAWLCAPLLFILALRFRRYVSAFVLLGIVLASMVIYPKMAQLQKAGRGSDQPDCVIVAAKGFALGHWPYTRSEMWSHTPMSCGPGWVLLQTPVVHLFGYRWNLLILWLGALFLFRLRLSWHQIAGLAVLIGLATATWVAASDGTDFITFGIVYAALFFALRNDNLSDFQNGMLFVLLCLTVQFRFPTLILPVLGLPRRKLRESITTSLLAFSYQLLFLIWRPGVFIKDGPLHLFFKLTHTSLFASSRWPAVLEISAVFTCMLFAAVFARRRWNGPWLSLAYLLILVVFPSIQDLLAKYHRYGSVLPALGLWEGANWLSSCLPLAAILLLFYLGEVPSLEHDEVGSPAARTVQTRKPSPVISTHFQPEA